ncbi:MAG: MBG domain-containing protein [Cytophagales bacterium]|nr:MBG domain-containing protein [Cytophagales bacterium]
MAATKVYGELDPTLSGAITGFLVADEIIATYSRTPAVPVTIVPYSISATLQPVNLLGNYDITYNLADFSITQAQLHASADNQSRLYGENNPTFTISYSGFKNGDNESSIESKTSCRYRCKSSQFGRYL